MRMLREGETLEEYAEEFWSIGGDPLEREREYLRLNHDPHYIGHMKRRIEDSAILDNDAEHTDR